jgi:hypothetical protein
MVYVRLSDRPSSFHVKYLLPRPPDAEDDEEEADVSE